MHLASRTASTPKLIVEPAVYAEMHACELQLHTWASEGHPSPPAEALVDVRTLSEVVDLIVCLGGDGTLLWASGLFPEAMPPVISFSMGSLGFLTPFNVDEHQLRLDHLLSSGC